ncbi:MAG TPA: sialidase family protein [Chloroflexota bacterium]|nr:sialidase family protein [Chloroflexota bacterium]
MFDTYVGTSNGVYRLSDSGVEPLGLESEDIRAIQAWREDGGTMILAGSYGNGMYRSGDGGRTWSRADAGLTATALRCICPDPLHPGSILAGSEPARIFRSGDGGRTWQEMGGITRIEGHETWFLPYSPRAGAVRNIWAPPGSAGRLFASVEVGGLLRSDDGGETWTCRPVIDDEDVHHITGHPHEADVLYASLGYASLTHRWRTDEQHEFGGVARSHDGGKTWRKLESDYTRATIIPPSRPDLVLAGPAPHVGRAGRIVASPDGGDTWEPADQGIETPMPDMVELFVAAPDDTVWAVCSGGRLLCATPGEWCWRSALPVDADLHVQSISFAMPDA